MSAEQPEDQALEQRLRSAAPALPPGLRAAVIGRALSARREAEVRRHRGRRWPVAAAACLATQWLLAAALSGQRASLLATRRSPGMQIAVSPGPRGAGHAGLPLHAGEMAFSVRRSTGAVVE